MVTNTPLTAKPASQFTASIALNYSPTMECPIEGCSHTMTSKSGLTWHLQTMHPGAALPSEPPKDASSVECPVEGCPHPPMKNKSGLTRHLRSMHPRYVPPPQTPYQFHDASITAGGDSQHDGVLRTPLHEQRLLAVRMLPLLTPL